MLHHSRKVLKLFNKGMPVCLSVRQSHLRLLKQKVKSNIAVPVVEKNLDEGEYTCTATSSVSHYSRNINIKVIGRNFILNMIK